MSVCAPISREELLANFLQLPANVVDNLRTLIVGADYTVYNAEVGTSTGLVGPYDELVGVLAAWPGLGSNQTVEQTTAVGLVEDALIRYFTEAGVPSVANGQQYLSVPNAIEHNAGVTIWSGPNYTPALNIPVVIGDYVSITDGSNTFSSTVTGFTYLVGEPTVLLLADNLPAWATGGSFFNVTLAEVVPELTLTSSDITTTSTTFQADPAITAATDRTGGVPYPLIGDTGYSAVYVNYVTYNTTLVSQGVISVRTEAEVALLFPSYQDPASGLGFAVWQALAPTLSDPDITYPAVLFVAVEDNTSSSWQSVITRVARRRDWYTVAPLTSDEAIIDLFVSMLAARRTISLNSRMDIALTLTTEETLFAGGATVTVDQSSTPGEDRTITRDGGATSPFTGAQAGDIVTVGSEVRIIETVLSAQTVTVTTSMTAGVGLTLVSVVHPYDASESATDYYTRASAYDSEMISVIFPPNPTWETVEIQGYLLSAMTAGLRGYTAPQQSLKGVILAVGWGVPSCVYEFLGELGNLGDNGCFVYEACETDLTRAVVLYPNTTDQSTTLTSREGLVANQDAIIRYLKDESGCFEGRVKVTAATLTAIQRTFTAAIQYLLSNTTVDPLGPILVSGVVGQPTQDSVQLDVINVTIDIVISTVLDDVDLRVNISIQVV
jgi:hypothetical protein